MRWQRLAFRSAAALLVAPSAASWASCFLPMGTFQSDTTAQQPPYWDSIQQGATAHLNENPESSLERDSAVERLRQWLRVSREDPQLVRPLLTPAVDSGRQLGQFSMPVAVGKVSSGGSNGLESVGQEGRGVSDSLQRLTSIVESQSADLEDAKQAPLPDFVNEGKQGGEGLSADTALRLNVLLLVIGTRGDVQPMAALGRVLKEQYGHRVRVATHAPFKSFVESQGLEFFPMPGNPNFLIDQMVSTSHRAQWSLPSSPAGILAVRKWFKGIIFSQWPACTAPPLQAPQRQDSAQIPDTAPVDGSSHWATAEARVKEEAMQPGGPNNLPPEEDVRHLTPPGIERLQSEAQAKLLLQTSLSSQSQATLDPGGFSPDLIVATPTTQVALSCAQRLGVPLHIFYFMPYTQTRHIPHPLSGATLPGPDGSKGTSFTWSLLESVAAVGVWDYVNRFRKQVLHLPFLPLGTLSEFFLLDKLAVPTTYAFSPDLVPKPKDWGEHIRIVNYAFDDGQAARYQPSPLLQRFLEGGGPPVYIGFGSMKVDDPEELMDTILTAVKAAGVRAIIHKRGWADDVEALQNRLASFGANRRRPRKSTSFRQRSDSLGAASARERRASGSFASEDILIYEEDVPHSWLFARCAAVVTHGGAGTVGAALRAGRPCMVVPFWGDQFLWGQLVAAAGVGPAAVPVSQLTEASLAAGLEDVRQDGMVQAAARIGDKIRGSANGVQSAAAHIAACLPVEALRCDGCHSRPAHVWACHKLSKLCHACAQDLVVADPLKAADLLPYRPVEWRFKERRGSCWGLCPESVFTPAQMREADWRSSAAVRRVVGTFVLPHSSLHEERGDNEGEREHTAKQLP